MYSKNELLKINLAGEREIYHDGALLPGTPLKNHRYEIIHLATVEDDCLIYKGIDFNTGDFVMIKEYFPKEAFGYDGAIYFERNLDTLKVEVKNPTSEIIKDALELMVSFVEENKYKEAVATNTSLTKITDDFQDYGTVYVVNSYNIWPSLATILKSEHELSFETLDAWVKDLIKQVMPFHNRGIVHRNLNPEHMFITMNGLVIDGLGMGQPLSLSNQFQDNKYFAPEVGENYNKIGTWTDVYAVSKIIIDLLIKMSNQSDYYKSLDQLPSQEIRQAYSHGVKQGVAYRIEDRFKTIMDLNEVLTKNTVAEKKSKPPKIVVAMILLLAFVSSSLVLWPSDPLTDQAEEDYRIIEQEETALGALEPVFFMLPAKKIFSLEDLTIAWFKTKETHMINFELLSGETVLVNEILTFNQMDIDLNEYGLLPGQYRASLSYKYEGDVYTVSLNITIAP